MDLKVKNIICTLIAGSCLSVLTAQQGGRGLAQTWWVAKTKGGVYIPPNKPLTKLADLKAMHAGQTNWTEAVVKDPEDEAYYNSAAPGTKFGRRLHPYTGTLMVVVEREMHFQIAGQDPIVATRGSIVNILRTTPYPKIAVAAVLIVVALTSAVGSRVMTLRAVGKR